MAHETPPEASTETDLLAEPSDDLALSPDDLPGSHMFPLAFHHALPDDPYEGLCIPSWHDLLDEAAAHLTPQGFPRTALTDCPPHQAVPSNSPAPDQGTFPNRTVLLPLMSTLGPALPGSLPSACQATQGGFQGSTDFCFSPALSEGPAQKRRRPGDSSMAAPSSMSLSWYQDQLSESDLLSSPTQDDVAYDPEQVDHMPHVTAAQTSTHNGSDKGETTSETLRKKVLQLTTMEIDSAVLAAQQPKRAPAPPAAQKGRTGAAKCTKRARASRSGQIKHDGSGHGLASGQGSVQHDGKGSGQQGQGKGAKPQGTALGKLLPFDSLKASTASSPLSDHCDLTVQRLFGGDCWLSVAATCIAATMSRFLQTQCACGSVS